MDKASFLLYRDLIHTVDKLTNEQAGRLFKHVLAYVNDLDPTLDDQVLQIAFEPIKQNLKRDLIKWEKRREQSREAGRIGGINRARNLKQSQANVASATNVKRPQANQAVNVSVSVIDIYNKHLNIIKKNKETEYAAWLGAICKKHGLQSSRIWRALEKFCEHLKVTEKVHEDISSFKVHFANWLDKQDQVKMLEEYKARKIGAL